MSFSVITLCYYIVSKSFEHGLAVQTLLSCLKRTLMCLYLEVIKLSHLTILQLESMKQISFVFLFMSDVFVFIWMFLISSSLLCCLCLNLTVYLFRCALYIHLYVSRGIRNSIKLDCILRRKAIYCVDSFQDVRNVILYIARYFC